MNRISDQMSRFSAKKRTGELKWNGLVGRVYQLDLIGLY